VTGAAGFLLVTAFTAALVAVVTWTAMNVLSVFFGLLSWTWLWGAWGTPLAVPMLAVLTSVADHVAPLKPLGRLLAA
jgi:predicted PurR-regulated permease PerM